MQPTANTEASRWYILTYTGNRDAALQRLSTVENLVFYVPEFFLEQSSLNRRDSWMFRNYAFIRGSQNDLYNLKKDVLQDFNFMRSNVGGSIQHPYISDYEINQLRKVEKMNDGRIPLTLSTEHIIVGDKIEILTGEFQGCVATAITKDRSRFRQIYLYIGDYFIIPLCQLPQEEFRVIQYANPAKKTAEFSFTAESTQSLLSAIRRFHGMQPSDNQSKADDCREVAKLIALCEMKRTLTINNRLKMLSLLGLGYMLSGDTDKGLRHLKIANDMMQQKVTMVARLFFATMRYLSTTLPEHYADFRVLRQQAFKSIPRDSSLLQFIDCVEDLHTHLSAQIPRKTSTELFTGGQNCEYWFCLTAPKKKTEAIRLFRDKDIPLYAPIVTVSRKEKDQKNVFKDLFFVKTTYIALTALRDEHRIFTILTTASDTGRHIVTYTDDTLETFIYLNSLDIPNKEILHYTPREEQNVLKAQKKTVTLHDRQLEGHLMTTRTPTQVHQKLVFLLPAVAAIAIDPGPLLTPLKGEG